MTPVKAKILVLIMRFFYCVLNYNSGGLLREFPLGMQELCLNNSGNNDGSKELSLNFDVIIGIEINS